MNELIKMRISTRFFPGTVWLGLLRAVLLLLLAACRGHAPAVPPEPQAFGSPEEVIDSYTTLTLLDKDDPTGAHWVDYFGGSVDIEGDLLVTGAPLWGRPSGDGKGAAHLYRRSDGGDWQPEATLIPSDRFDGFQFDQHFGESLALNGRVIAVGAPGADDPQAGVDTGAVYIFEHDGRAWVETAKLTSNLHKPAAEFGTALAFDGDTLAVSGSPEAGFVVIFRREAGGWREVAQLPVPSFPDRKPEVLIDLYGETLAISTVTMPLAPPDDAPEELLIRSIISEGVVTLFERSGDGWDRTFQTAPQEAALYRMWEEVPFGLPVSLGGEGGKANYLAVGKPGWPGSGRERGAVVLFERGESGWKPQTELVLTDQEPIQGAPRFFGRGPGDPGTDPGEAFFGAFVEFEGKRLAVVSTFANAVYVFDRQDSEWVYRFLVTPAPGFGDDFQRRTVAMSGDSLLLGSPGELGGGYIFVFELAP